MFYWRFHLKSEIPIDCLFTQWKWTCILDLEPWRWSALNMGYIDKRLSRMQGQSFLFQSRVERAVVFNRALKILNIFCGGCSEVLDRWIHIPLNVRRGRVSIRPQLMVSPWRVSHFGTNFSDYENVARTLNSPISAGGDLAWVTLIS